MEHTLLNAVQDWLARYDEEEQKVVLEDLQRSGCISGMVSPLVNYVDTIAFYEEHKAEINELLADMEADLGEPVLKTLGGYDKTDPLCLEQQNQNLLAWFGFEEAAAEIYREKYE